MADVVGDDIAAEALKLEPLERSQKTYPLPSSLRTRSPSPGTSPNQSAYHSVTVRTLLSGTNLSLHPVPRKQSTRDRSTQSSRHPQTPQPQLRRLSPPTMLHVLDDDAACFLSEVAIHEKRRECDGWLGLAWAANVLYIPKRTPNERQGSSLGVQVRFRHLTYPS